MPENSIIYVPDLAVFSQKDASEMKEDFHRRWGMKPTAVALPICSPSGVPFVNDYVDKQRVRYKDLQAPLLLQDLLERFVDLDLDIYFTLDPALRFIRSDFLHIVDISGDSSAQVCPNKRKTKQLARHLIKKALEIGMEICRGRKSSVKGLIIDTTNILPMGTTNERIELTCFCQECQEQLRTFTTIPNLIEQFKTFPNPWNLVLKDSGTGIGQINEIGWDTPPQAIMGLSRLKGFDNSFKDTNENEMIDLASLLIDYLHARHLQVISSIREMFEVLRETESSKSHSKLNRILLTEGSSYNWTSGLFLEKIDNSEVCDEIWFDPNEQGFQTENVSYRTFMWKRSTYFLNAFFGMLNNVQDDFMRTYTGLARKSVAEVRQLLRLRMRQAMGAAITQRVDLLLLPDPSESKRIGFVSPTLDEETCLRLVENAQIPDGIQENDHQPDELLQRLLQAMRGPD